MSATSAWSGTAQSVGDARRIRIAISELLVQHGVGPASIHDACLTATELITDALDGGTRDVTLTVTVDPDCVMLHAAHPELGPPIGEDGPAPASGWSLALVRAVADTFDQHVDRGVRRRTVTLRR